MLSEFDFFNFDSDSHNDGDYLHSSGTAVLLRLPFFYTIVFAHPIDQCGLHYSQYLLKRDESTRTQLGPELPN